MKTQLPVRGLLEPAEFSRGEPLFLNASIRTMCLNAITSGGYFYSYKVKQMKKDLDTASEVLDQAKDNFNQRLDGFADSQNKLMETTKKTCGHIRDQTDKLNQAFAKLEKQGNLDVIERYVAVFERAEKALSTLAELEANGKLDRIFKAVK